MMKYTEDIKDITENWETPYISTPQRVGMILSRKEGISSLLTKQLKRRFPHDVTEHYLHLLEEADSNTLSMWVENLMDAKKIDEVFAETCSTHR